MVVSTKVTVEPNVTPMIRNAGVPEAVLRVIVAPFPLIVNE
jgi:hypothetical protein